MAATVPTTEPASIRAGETLHFTRSLSDYPASDGWSITYSFRAKNGSAIDFTTTALVDDHEASVAFGDTAGWIPGTYDGVGMVSDGTTKTQIWQGQMTVLQNFAALQEGADTRTQNRRTFDNICAVLEGRASSAILSSSVDGTQIQRIPIADLLMLRERYATLVANEENAVLALQGKPSRKTILAKFVAS